MQSRISLLQALSLFGGKVNRVGLNLTQLMLAEKHCRALWER
jgi:hypothetical protein